MLVLLDGLDEVREEDTKRVLRQIREFSDKFHQNQFVITCRIAAKEYTFEQFTEVEVADFDKEQIAFFAQNWFRRSDPAKAERFIQKLKENEPIQELASSPLLLTLLCLVFQKKEDFPKKRSDLYQEGIEILLKTWDIKRGIERDELYKNLSLKKKQALLSQIALATFEQQNYFFKPELVEEIIEDFFCRLSGSDLKKEDLEVDSKDVLRAIEAQHGLLIERAKNIYSFSHLTFQEYFAARAIVVNSAYKNLVKHLTEKHWREVFLLTTSMMRDADDLLRLMKQHLDELLATDQKLQQFLSWVSQKSNLVEELYKPAAVRAFYLSLARAIDSPVIDDFALTFNRGFLVNFALVLALDLNPPFYHDFPITFDYPLALDYTLAQINARAHILNHKLAYTRNSDLAYARTLNLENALNQANKCTPAFRLRSKLQEMKEQLPDSSWEGQEDSEQWWKVNGQAWTEQLRAVTIEHRNIGHDWQFNDEQKKLLQQYYNANKLLVDCLNSDCYVSREVRQDIEDTLLLPMSEIKG
jgi:predicted NACHT family NTPase